VIKLAYSGRTYITTTYGDDEMVVTCHSVGIGGGCGLDCPVYKDGECQNHLEAIQYLKTADEKEHYMEYYGDYLYNYAIGEK
jgi:hypothetical protein